jgi:hypothetical protein
MRGRWQSAGVWALGLASAATNGCGLDDSGLREPLPNCGNGVRNSGEQCDGADLGNATCASLGYLGGTLDCLTSCSFDTARCGANCGDGTRQAPEQCDGLDLGGTGCVALGFLGGTLGCDSHCSFDTSACSSTCGNGTLDPPEECDGANLAGKSCQNFGLDPGTLGCTHSCTFDLTHCPGCGNGLIEVGELCDGADLGGFDCAGGLSCTADCLLDPSACTLASVGDGADGALEVSGWYDLTTNDAPAYAVTTLSSAGAVVGTTVVGIAPGDEVLLINLQGSASECTRTGTYEFLHVQSATGTQVGFTAPVQGIYGLNGGNANLTGQKIALVRVPHFSSVHVASGASLTAEAWNGATGGVVGMRVAGGLSVDANGTLSADGLGFAGGAGISGAYGAVGTPGESVCGKAPGASVLANKGGGGGGQVGVGSDQCGQGGGGAGFGHAGTFFGFASACPADNNNAASNGGGTYGSADLAALLFGSGGGGGATDDWGNYSGGGGLGGGLVLTFAKQVTIDGTLSARGLGGALSTSPNDTGNGGGGSGGSIYLLGGSIHGSGVVTAIGGLGGTTSNTWNSPGGDGGVGRIRIDYQQAGGFAYGTQQAKDFLVGMVEPDPGATGPYLD